MLWSHIKSWAKEHGYSSFREKVDGQENQYDYYWAKENDVSVTGLATSVSKLATQIYNDLTNNQYVEYQTEYKNKLAHTDIDHNGLSTNW